MGKLDERWTDWFGGMEISAEGSEDSPVTVLTGPVVDQAALRGLLTKIWDLNLAVISVLMVAQYPERPGATATTGHTEDTEG